MPIKSLEPYLFDLKAVHNCQLDVLTNATIGIDVEHYLSRLFTPRKEPNLEAIGGFPMTLKLLADSDFKVFKELNIKPIFVFPGLNTAVKYNYLEQSEPLPYEKNFKQVWIEKTTRDYCLDSFRDSNSPLSLRPIMNQFMEFLEDRGMNYIVSPYSAWHQLQYMLAENVIHTIFGSTDGLLVDGVDKFVFSIEFESRQFKYIDRANVLNRLNLSSKYFKDIAMVIGNGFQPFSLNIFPHIPSLASFPSLHEFVLSGGSIYNTLLSLNDGNKTMSIFQKGVASLEYMPIMKLSGRVEPSQMDTDSSFLSSAPPTASSGASGSSPTDSQVSTPANSSGSLNGDKDQMNRVPNDMHEFIGQRLPDELFFYQSVGITLFELCETLIHGNEVERLPSEMSVTPLYQELITGDKSLELKGLTLNLLANSLNRYYQFKKLKTTTYFAAAQEYELVQRLPSPIYLKLKPLIIRHTTARSFELTTLLTSLTNELLEESTVTKEKVAKSDSDEDFKVATSYELISTSLVRSLVVLDFISIDGFKLTEWGNILPFVAKSANVEVLLLLLIFFKRFPSLTADDIINPSDMKAVNKKYKSAAILISKVLAILPIEKLSPINYMNRVSRPLSQFRSVMAKLSTSTNDLINANMIALLLVNQDDYDKYTRTNDAWRRLATEIPFRNGLPNVLLGIISQQFFENYLLELEIGKSISAINDQFKIVCEKPSGEFKKGLKVFEDVVGMVELLFEKGLMKNKTVLELFTTAGELASSIVENL